MMRKSLSILFVFAVAFPALSFASTRPPLDPAKCPTGSSSEMTGTKSTTFTKDTNAAQAKSFLQAALYCPNACYDLKATLTLSFSGLQVSVSGTNKCSSSVKAPNDPSQTTPRGCSAGLQQPQVTIITQQIYSNVIGFNVPDQSISKSRCDSNTLETSMTGFFSGLSQVMSNPQGAQAQMIASLDQLRSTPTSVTVTPTLTSQAAVQAAQQALQNPQNQSVMTQALVNLGATPQQAQSIVNGDPQSAQRLLSDVAAGNTSAIRTDATTLNLNPSLAGNAVSLNTGQSVGNSSGVIVGAPVAIGAVNTAPTTFESTGSVFGNGAGTSWGSGIASAIGSLFSPLIQLIRQSLFSTAPTTAQPTPTAQSPQMVTPPAPAVTILAQPSSMRSGQRVLVSWSSVNTTGCTISYNGSQVAQGLNGTYGQLASTTGTMDFIASCSSPFGAITRDAAVNVQ